MCYVTQPPHPLHSTPSCSATSDLVCPPHPQKCYFFLIVGFSDIFKVLVCSPPLVFPLLWYLLKSSSHLVRRSPGDAPLKVVRFSSSDGNTSIDSSRQSIWLLVGRVEIPTVCWFSQFHPWVKTDHFCLQTLNPSLKTKGHRTVRASVACGELTARKHPVCSRRWQLIETD